MGLFPYDCPICGGGEESWEHMVVYIEIYSNCYQTAPYSGYGYLERKEKDKKHYTEFYEKRTENMIRDVYKEDIRTWGYEFGD